MAGLLLGAGKIIHDLQQELENSGDECTRYEAEKDYYSAKCSFLTSELKRRNDVIIELERIKGVSVSEVTYYAPTGNNTKTGTAPTEGKTIAVDPSVIPLGSDVYIEGIGWRKAEDTGGAIKGTDVDVFVGSEAEANRGGRDRLRILWRAPDGN